VGSAAWSGEAFIASKDWAIALSVTFAEEGAASGRPAISIRA
jgi:hypothetical protein